MTAPIEYQTTRYRCPHCRRSYAHRATATKHMPLCFADPARRTCKTCRHDDRPYYDHVAEEYHEGGCLLGLNQGPSCVGCGEHPEVCRCEVGQQRAPANRLRVCCDKWEGRL